LDEKSSNISYFNLSDSLDILVWHSTILNPAKWFILWLW